MAAVKENREATNDLAKMLGLAVYCPPLSYTELRIEM
jgi:hypothetical protein